jgi:PAS domain S-box-containing protein/putative nucleotidyltransferase with HDIG domain
MAPKKPRIAPAGSALDGKKIEDRYHTLVEKAFEGIIVVQDGKIVFANSRAYQIIGQSNERKEPRPFTDFIHPDDKERVVDRHLRRLKGEQFEETYPIRLVDQNGNIKWTLISAALIDWEDKPATLTLVTDITERKLAEVALQDSELRFRELFNHMSSGAAVYEAVDNGGDFILRDFNPAAEKIEKVSRQNILGKRVSEAFPGVKTFGIFEVLQRVWQTGKPEYFPENIYKDAKDAGSWRESWVFKLPGGEIVAVYNDVTERKIMGNALKESGETFKAIVETMPLAIYLSVGVQQISEYISPTMVKLFGYTMEDIPTVADWWPLAYPDETYRRQISEEWTIKIKRAIETRSSIETMETVVTCKDGSKKNISWGYITMGDKNYAFGLDLTERKRAEEKLLKSYESVKKTLNDAINTIAKIVEVRDPYTAGHQQKVAGLATAIARELKLEDTRIDNLRMAAVIHDIGKMYIPSDILHRPGKLTDMEFALIKTHAQGSYDIVKGMDFPNAVAWTVLQHHERLDGSGYPNQLKGEDTLLEAKILAVADVVEAMASHRPYRPALGLAKALAEIVQNRGRLYDCDVVDTCVRLFREKAFSFDA